MKAIVLAGGLGTRLYPTTNAINKHLFPLYNKPLIYYPLSVIFLAKIKDILIILNQSDYKLFYKLLGDGKQFGVTITYAFQENPNGIAEAFKIGKNFIGKSDVCLILGDNIFHGDEFISNINIAKKDLSNGYSSIFGVPVPNPESFGVIEFDDKNNIIKISEKPDFAKSNIIVSGLYFYTNDVIGYAKNLKPSKRGEKEITDINNFYLATKKLKLNLLDDSTAWIDTGTYSSLIKASKYFENYEKKSAKKAACIEEIAYNMGYIDISQLNKIANSMRNSEYGNYLLNLILK